MKTETVKCPYCNHECKIDTSDFEGDSEMDIECENDDCEKEFEVHVHFFPSYSASTIEYITCEICGSEARIGCGASRLDGKDLCSKCYALEYFKHLEHLKGENDGKL